MKKKFERKDSAGQLPLIFEEPKPAKVLIPLSNVIQFEPKNFKVGHEKRNIENRQLMDRLISYSKNFGW
jgi:hypothetical protein